MKRDEFLKTFGIGVAVVCTGCFAACKKGGSDSDGGPNAPTPPSGVNISVDLNSELRNVGESKTSNGVIIVRTAAENLAASFIAVQVACTHQGTSINYNTNQGEFICPNHGSQFSTSGAVLQGPATANLKAYKVAVAGNVLTVTS